MRWNKKQIIEYLDNQEDWIFEIKKIRKRRSVSQNAYLHFIFSLIASETWETLVNVKKSMKSLFLKQYNTTFNTVITKETSELDTKEMTQFIEKIRVFALDFLNLEIPQPDNSRLLEYIDNLDINF